MADYIRPPFPEVIDNSLMSAFRSCPQKAFREFLQHYKPGKQSVHLHAGAAFAAGLEAAREAFYLHNLPHEECVKVGVKKLFTTYGNFECPADSPKSAERMAGALVYYFDHFNMETDHCKPVVMPGGKIGVEFNFLEPIDLLHPVTGNPLLYSGRFDMLAEYMGQRMGEDDKTTSSLGASWPAQWDLRSQFTGYAWGAAKHGFPLGGFVIRGVSILKTKYDHAEAITYRQQWQIDRWYEQLIRDLSRMISMWQNGNWDFNLDEACNSYGGCIFRKVCLSANPDRWLAAEFERRQWDPVARTETKLPPIIEVAS